MIDLDVARATACQDSVIWRSERAIVFETPTSQWAYAVRFELPEVHHPFAVEVTMGAEAGRVGVACVDASGTRLVSGEASVSPNDGTTTRRVLVETDGARTLVFRNLAQGSSIGRIEQIGLRPGAQYSPVELKRMRADRYPYWHYSFDLGDGVGVTATLDGIMGVHELNQRLMLGLIRDHFDRSAITTCLDVASNAGFHAFALAREGWSVTAIDVDRSAIEQGQFVQACAADGPEKTVRFRCEDLQALDAREQYDVVFCSGLFYHLYDPVGAARRIARAARMGAVVQSFVSGLSGDVLELADAAKYVCCSPGEFSFVPTASALASIFRFAGFRDVQTFRASALCPDGEFEALKPQYADLFRHRAAYYVLKV